MQQQHKDINGYSWQRPNYTCYYTRNLVLYVHSNIVCQMSVYHWHGFGGCWLVGCPVLFMSGWLFNLSSSTEDPQGEISECSLNDNSNDHPTFVSHQTSSSCLRAWNTGRAPLLVCLCKSSHWSVGQRCSGGKALFEPLSHYINLQGGFERCLTWAKEKWDFLYFLLHFRFFRSLTGEEITPPAKHRAECLIAHEAFMVVAMEAV